MIRMVPDVLADYVTEPPLDVVLVLYFWHYCHPCPVPSSYCYIGDIRVVKDVIVQSDSFCRRHLSFNGSHKDKSGRFSSVYSSRSEGGVGGCRSWAISGGQPATVMSGEELELE